MVKRKAEGGDEEGPLVLKRARPLTTPLPRLAKLEKRVNSIAKAIETNYIDTQINKAIAYDVNTFVDLSAISSDVATASGAAGTRQGSWVQPTMLEARLRFHQPFDPTIQNPTAVRFMLIQAKQRFTPSTVAVGATTAVLANQNSNFSFLAPYDKDNRRHFTVLHEQSFTLGGWSNSSVGASSIPQDRIFTIKKKLSRRIAFELNGATKEGGAIYWIAYSDTAAAQTEPVCTGLVRVHYRDL